MDCDTLYLCMPSCPLSVLSSVPSDRPSSSLPLPLFAFVIYERPSHNITPSTLIVYCIVTLGHLLGFHHFIMIYLRTSIVIVLNDCNCYDAIWFAILFVYVAISFFYCLYHMSVLTSGFITVTPIRSCLVHLGLSPIFMPHCFAHDHPLDVD
jgi:hypothetical protein